MSKIEKANIILEDIRGKDYVRKNPFTSEERAEEFILTINGLILDSSASDYDEWMNE